MTTKETNKRTLSQRTDVLNPVQLFSIVMPAYNEEGVIEQTLLELISHLDSHDFRYEIVVVNDGSTDQTESILNNIEKTHDVVRHVNNEGPGGYGFAVRKGLEAYREIGRAHV